jgi:hypothetical protein
VDIQLTDEWADISISELADLMEENYYLLASTGQDAFLAFADDVLRGAFTEYHGMSEERTALLMVEFVKRMVLVWDKPAVPYEVR